MPNPYGHESHAFDPYAEAAKAYGSSYENDEDNPSPTMSGKEFLSEILGMAGAGAGRESGGLGALFASMREPDYKWTHKIEVHTTIVDVDGESFDINPWEMDCHSVKEEFDKFENMARMSQRASDLLKEHGSMGVSVGEEYFTFMAHSISRIVFSSKYLGKEPFDLEKAKAKEAEQHERFH